MKSLEEIFSEVLSNEKLMEKYEALQNAEEQVAFVKELGGEATADEIADFLDKKNNHFGELSDEELDQVVGGKGSTTACPYCGSTDTVSTPDCGGTGIVYYCNSCSKRWYN